ncbi:MutS domain V protein [Clostridiales bacterium oral taxon 876 str. F0540]|nr:MutS domain V protein [Clostridiales bacterium oral taxon 876 str. F0540]
MTAFGIEEKKKLVPYCDREKLLEELNNVESFIESMLKNKASAGEIERVFCRVKDIRATAKRCKNLTTLDDVELYEIKYFALLTRELIEAYENLNLNINCIKLRSLEKVVSILDPENKKLSTFYIYDSYSDNLKLIREKKKKLEELIFKESKEEEAARLKALRMKVVIEEQEEELIIRKDLTEKLSSFAELIEENIYSIGRLDFLMAKSKLALSYEGIKPNITENMKISLRNMFNPEVSETLKAKGKPFIPVSVELNCGTTVITGANMGGKSVALKTIVLNVLLAQYGFYVFAKEAEIPILSFIYFISDDMQSVSKGLSTFGAEIVKLKEVIEDAQSSQGFIALDEFARGTNPKEGLYLVKAICKYLNIYKSISVISTHYDGAVSENMTHYQVIGLKNIDFNLLRQRIKSDKINSVSLIQEHMDYRLEKVNTHSEVPKDALNICTLLGLQDDVIDIAREEYRDNGYGE